jgi:hypothetical protein
MLKNSMIVGVLMLALSSSADAALLGASTLMPESATKVAWVCGPFRCVWRRDGTALCRHSLSGGRLVCSGASTRGATIIGLRSALNRS